MQFHFRYYTLPRLSSIRPPWIPFGGNHSNPFHAHFTGFISTAFYFITLSFCLLLFFHLTLMILRFLASHTHKFQKYSFCVSYWGSTYPLFPLSAIHSASTVLSPISVGPSPHQNNKNKQTNKITVEGFIVTTTQIDDIQISLLSKNVSYSDQCVTF